MPVASVFSPLKLMSISDKNSNKDICVVGGGPAGIFAAIIAAQNGAKTTLIEKNTALCRKLLYTGGKRCNFTHTGSIEDFLKAYDTFGRFLKPCLHEFSPQDLIKYFQSRGLAAKVEPDGCIFPVTDRSSDVAGTLTSHARSLGVNFLYDKPVRSIEQNEHGFEISIAGQSLLAASVIIATGGMSWPFTGSTGDGYSLAKSLGHYIVSPRASLVPLVTAEKWPASIAGVSIPNVTIKAKLPNNRKISVSGALLFTGDGIGGFATFDLSRFITDFLPDNDNPIKIFIDLMPDFSIDQLESRIMDLCTKNPKKEIAGVLVEFLPRSLMLNLAQQISPSQTILAGALTKEMRKAMIKLLKELPLSIVSTRPIADATVTRGGVDTSQINSKTMESKIRKGLFFAGEVIDVDGPCGGYNLQIAFSTAHMAASSAAKLVHK
jgi:predicted Rossmann fold flavoprotein